jgi:selenophosphate synthetase-related protein
MKKEINLNECEIGKEYRFELLNRKRAMKATLLKKDIVYTGLSLYHGDDAIEIKRRNKRYVVAVHGIYKITIA